MTTLHSYHLPSEVSLNFSLLFFFRHFHGLKILPSVENLPLRFGVLSPTLPPSPTIALWCCSVSSSEHKKQFCIIQGHLGYFMKDTIAQNMIQKIMILTGPFIEGCGHYSYNYLSLLLRFGRVMMREHGLLHISTVNRRGLMLALIQDFLLLSAHIPQLDGDQCLISFSAIVASILM